MRPFPESACLVPHTRFGRGHIAALPAACRPFGPHGLLVYGESLQKNGTLDRLRRQARSHVEWTEWKHPGGEPALDQAEALRTAARIAHADWIAAVGGGSVLDLAKTAAGLFHEPGPVAAFFRGQAVTTQGLPFLAAPSTAGTGAEATPNAVLTDPQTALKKSIRHDRFMARTVILDSALLAGSPPAVIAHAGMDAFTQALEAFSSSTSNVWSGATALAALRLIGASLPTVFRDSASPEADSLLAGSHLAGIALAQARLGVVHGLAHPLGSFYRQPHGLVCAVCLPAALDLNRDSMGANYQLLSDAVGRDIAAFTGQLLATLQISNPFKGQTILRKEEIVEQTLSSGSTAANPKRITRADVEFLLSRLFS